MFGALAQSCSAGIWLSLAFSDCAHKTDIAVMPNISAAMGVAVICMHAAEEQAWFQGEVAQHRIFKFPAH